MVTAGRQAGMPEATEADCILDSQSCAAQATWRQRRRFQHAARALVRIPAPGAAPLEHLFTEDRWRELIPPDDHEETVLAALSQATGVYFLPSREWALALGRFIHLLGLRRVLEAGAGRGYLAAALAPMLTRQGVAFKAVDNAQGEFESGLPRHPLVSQSDVFTAVQSYRPDFILYAWPPPGQSIGPLCRNAGVRYVLVLGEPNGGCTGAPADWHNFRHRCIGLLSRRGLGRSGRRRQAATLFFGAASPQFQESPI